MANKIIEILAQNPKLFNFLRNILENNFKNQKEVVRRFSLDYEGDKVLDIGCGTGEFSVFFNSGGYVGIDTEKKYIDYASRNLKGKFLTADAASLPFGDNYFDKIIINSVLHHLSDEECLVIFEEARRVLRPGGRMLVVDADAGLGNFLSRLLYRLDRGKHMRKGEGYEKLLSQEFEIEKNSVFKDGFYYRREFILK